MPATSPPPNYGGAGASTVGAALVVDSSGNQYVTGHFSIASLTTKWNGSGNTQFVLRLDAYTAQGVTVK